MKREGYILIGFTVLIIGAIVSAVLARRRASYKNNVFDKIITILNNNIGVKGEDANSLLLEVKPDLAYRPAKDIQVLLKAPSSKNLGLSDDDEAIYSVIRRLNKRQLKALDNQMLTSYGKSLNDFLKEVFTEITDCRKTNPFENCKYPKYEKAIKMIKSK